jgi:maltose alpha-D-glucosyltransferase/alpha-amylase
LAEHEFLNLAHLSALLDARASLAQGPDLRVALGAYLKKKRWYRDKARRERGVEGVDVIPLSTTVAFLLLRVSFEEGSPSEYGVLVALLQRGNGTQVSNLGDVIIAEVNVDGTSGVLIDAAHLKETPALLLELIALGQEALGKSAALVGARQDEFLEQGRRVPRDGRLLLGEQTNTNYQFGERFVLKLLRKLEAEESLEVEVLAQLGRAQFAHAPRLVGTLELRRELAPSCPLGILQTFVPNAGDAWQLARESAERFVQKTRPSGFPDLAAPDFVGAQVSLEDEFFSQMEMLGRRTAELHCALSLSEVLGRKPEDWNEQSKRAYCQNLSALASRALALLRLSERESPREERALRARILGEEELLREKIDALTAAAFSGPLIRVHGDLHLGQVLWTGRDFTFVDFEGEPARDPAERRRKRSPLADIAGMLRSFHYAALSQFLDMPPERDVSDDEAARAWAEIWQQQAGTRFLKGYTEEVSANRLLPQEEVERRTLLEAHLLEKSLYEVIYELENRPEWVCIPLFALVSLMGREAN